MRRLDKPGVVSLDTASLPELADSLYHAMHPYDIIVPPQEYNECKGEYADDKSNARDQRGLLHSLCAWWHQGTDMLCKQISHPGQCQRFVKDAFAENPRMRGECDDVKSSLPFPSLPPPKPSSQRLNLG